MTAAGCLGGSPFDELLRLDAGTGGGDFPSPDAATKPPKPIGDAAAMGGADAPPHSTRSDACSAADPDMCTSVAKSLTLTGPTVVRDTRVFSLSSARGTPAAESPLLPAMAWTWGGESAASRSLVKVELDSLPREAQIVSATLVLHGEPGASAPPFYKGHHALSGVNDGWLLRVKEPWEAAMATWEAQPVAAEMPPVPVTTADAVYLAPSQSTDETYRLDVTAAVRQMHDGSVPNFGFLLRLREEAHYRSLSFCSTDYPDAALRPSLEIVYQQTRCP